MERNDRRITQLVLGSMVLTLAAGLTVAWETYAAVAAAIYLAFALVSACVGGIALWRRRRAGALLFACDWRSGLRSSLTMGGVYALLSPITLHHNSGLREVAGTVVLIFLTSLQLALVGVLCRPQVRRRGIVVRLRTVAWGRIVAYDLRDRYLSLQVRLANGGTRFMAVTIGRVDRAAVSEALAEYAPLNYHRE